MGEVILPDLSGTSGFGLARKALDEMATHTVPPTPHNYEVWVGFVANASKELRQQIEKLIAQNQPFTPAINEALYEEFFGGSRLSTQVAMTSERIAKELSDMLSTLQAAGRQTGAYGGELAAAATRLENGVDPTTLRDLVASLARATREMAEQNQTLSKRLEDTSREVAQMRETLHVARAEALSDSLTGLSNRKAFDQTLRMRLHEAMPGRGGDLCLMICDIDMFKKFNDTWGHQTGDQVIRFVASALKAAALPDMMAARYGGEEFAMIMPRTNLAAARQIAEHIRHKIESKVLVRKSTGEDLGRVSVSAGIAMFRSSDTASTLVERADECLYISKRTGRNRVTLETDAVAAAVA